MLDRQTDKFCQFVGTDKTVLDLVVISLVLGYLTDRSTNSVGLLAPTKPTGFDLVISLGLGCLTDKPKDRQILSISLHQQNRQFCRHHVECGIGINTPTL